MAQTITTPQFEKKFRPAKAGLKKGKRKEGKRGKGEK
jgi:hypothetical protein